MTEVVRTEVETEEVETEEVETEEVEKKLSAKQKKNQVMEALRKKIKKVLIEKLNEDLITIKEASDIEEMFDPILDTYKTKYKSKPKAKKS